MARRYRPMKKGRPSCPPPLPLKIKRSCTPCRISLPGLPRPASSDQAPLRRPGGTTYRCFLPDLTGFVGSCRAGPGPQRRFSSAVPESAEPRGGIRPRISGFRVQGTASSPSSTTAVMMIPHGWKKVKLATRAGDVPALAFLAERVGFEPTGHFCPHALQACALGQTMLPLRAAIYYTIKGLRFQVAGGVGFEPTVELPPQRFSRPSRSSTPAPSPAKIIA